ncbi:MAG: hypothetical protein U9P71_04275 [Campylobacterota bacterium]|nr:hypothetical protein [Campylobacterota bacterium]
MSNSINEELFEQIKSLLIENERLFSKLRRTAEQYKSIDFDESGLYDDDEETAIRHWDKLSSKITLNLNDTIEDYTVTRLEVTSPDKYSVCFEVSNGEESHKLHVSYLNEGELTIS